MGTSTSLAFHPVVNKCRMCPETRFDDDMCTVASSALAMGLYSQFAEDEVADREPSGMLSIKATLVSNALRCLSRRDDECSWKQLRCEFEAQRGIWEQLCRGDEARHEGLSAQLKSQLECGLAMRQGGCNGEAVAALESALMTDEAAASTHLARHVTAAEATDTDAAGKARLCPTMKACAEEVLAQMRVSQARNELADFLDMVSALDESRFDKPQSWFLSKAKACDLRHGVLKEYLSEVFAAEAQLRALRPVVATNGCGEQA